MIQFLLRSTEVDLAENDMEVFSVQLIQIDMLLNTELEEVSGVRGQKQLQLVRLPLQGLLGGNLVMVEELNKDRASLFDGDFEVLLKEVLQKLLDLVFSEIEEFLLQEFLETVSVDETLRVEQVVEFLEDSPEGQALLKEEHFLMQDDLVDVLL